MESLPDDIIYLLMSKFMDRCTVENFRMVNKNVANIFKEIISSEKDTFKEHHYEILGVTSYVKGEDVQWGPSLEGFWYNGKQEGLHITGNNHTVYEINYKNGIKDGAYKCTIDGQTYLKGMYKDGQRVGLWILFHEAEQYNYDTGERFIYKHGVLRENHINSVYKYYYSNGELYKIIDYKTGELSVYKHVTSEMGFRYIKKIITGYLSNNVKNGTWTYYYDNKTLKKTGNYENNKRVGIWHFYKRGVYKWSYNYDTELLEKAVSPS